MMGSMFSDADGPAGPPVPAGSRKRARPAKEGGDPEVAACIDLFYRLHVRKWSAPQDVAAWEADPSSIPKERLVAPRVEGGKHGRKFKTMLGQWGPEVVKQLIERFFATTDPRITNTDYTYDAFFLRADYLRLQAVRQAIPERTRRNLDAAAKAMGRE